MRSRSIDRESPEMIREKNKRRLAMLENSYKGPQFENLKPAKTLKAYDEDVYQILGNY